MSDTRLLEYLRSHAGGCHPDLALRFRELVAGAGDVREEHDLPLAVTSDGVIFAFAHGTSWVGLRVAPALQPALIDAPGSDERARAEVRERTLEFGEAIGPEWVAVDPWPLDLPEAEATEQLRGWFAQSARRLAS